MIQVVRPCVGEDEVEAVREVLLSGRYVSGARVETFESAFAAYIGTDYAVATSSGTASLHLALLSLGIRPGDEVIVPALTFFATVSAVLHARAVPVFADIEPDSLCLDPADVASRITERTRAILAVHLYGYPADMDGLLDLGTRLGLAVVEDCAQAHGTTFGDSKVGGLGEIGAFSFFATKHLTTGEGGMLTTNREGLAETARRLRSHGMTDRNTHAVLGYNYRMTEMAAAMGLVQLRKLDAMNARRIANSEYLIANLKSVPWIKFVQQGNRGQHTYFWCPIQVHEEVLEFSTQVLIDKLFKAGIEVRRRYLQPLYRQPLLTEGDLDLPREVEFSSCFLPDTEAAAGRLIGLPNHPGLTRVDLDRVVEALISMAD